MCHSRVTRQIYWATSKLHAKSEQICWATRMLHASTKQTCWATCELHVSASSDALMKSTTHEEGIMLRVKCMHGRGTSESGFN